MILQHGSDGFQWSGAANDRFCSQHRKSMPACAPCGGAQAKLRNLQSQNQLVWIGVFRCDEKWRPSEKCAVMSAVRHSSSIPKRKLLIDSHIEKKVTGT